MWGAVWLLLEQEGACLEGRALAYWYTHAHMGTRTSAGPALAA